MLEWSNSYQFLAAQKGWKLYSLSGHYYIFPINGAFDNSASGASCFVIAGAMTLLKNHPNIHTDNWILLSIYFVALALVKKTNLLEYEDILYEYKENMIEDFYNELESENV